MSENKIMLAFAYGDQNPSPETSGSEELKDLQAVVQSGIYGNFLPIPDVC